jgi:hypothetical protein
MIETMPLLILLRAFPLKPLWGMIALLWVAGENYPFSPFPMYSDFTDWDYVVLIADQDGRALPLEHLTAGIRTARLKKQFNGEMNEIARSMKDEQGRAARKRDLQAGQLGPAGESALRWIGPHLATRRLEPGVTALQLRRITIELAGGGLRVGEPETVATLPLAEILPPAR